MELIKLKYIKNFRDLGGIKTTDGHTIKSHMLIRGTAPVKLTEEDIVLLKEKYKLATIIDLRTKKESEEQPDTQLDGVKYLHMPILTEAAVGVSHEKKVHSMKSLVMMPPMEEMYVRMVTSDCLDRLVEVLRSILTMPEENYSLVFHCTAGKDRTGILAALILSFLGVDRDTVVDDYIYSNRFTVTKARFVYIACLIVKLRHRFAKKVMHSLMAKRNFIEAALSTLEKNFGSLENFFAEKLQFSEEETKAIKAKFLC